MHLWTWQWAFPPAVYAALKVIATIQGLKQGRIKPWSLFSSKCCGRRSGICCVKSINSYARSWNRTRVGDFKLFQKECPPCPKTLGIWIPETPLYSLVSREQTWRYENKYAYGDKLGIVIPFPVGNALTSHIQKQNHLNQQCNWEVSGQVHVQTWDACCTWDTLWDTDLWRFVKVVFLGRL